MPARAKIFMSGNSQAVRLPKEFRFDSDEVEISREGERVIMTLPQADREPWADLKAFWAQGGFSEDFMIDGRDQGEFTDRPGLEDMFK